MAHDRHLAAGGVVTRFFGRTEGTAQIKLMRNLPPLSVQSASGFLSSPSPNLPDGTLTENDADAMREPNVVLGSSPDVGLPLSWLTPRGSFEALKYREYLRKDSWPKRSGRNI